MNDITTYRNDMFGEIRTLEENGKVLFCGSDVAKALGYAKTREAVVAHCRSTVKRGTPHPQSKEKQIEMLFIPEGDVYRLITHSKLPEAQKFESWVFDEVLPSIRSHGAYMTPDTIERVLMNPDTIIELATRLKDAQAKIEADKPKVLFADAVSDSEDTILIRELAKLLTQNGYKIGEKRLYQKLREEGYLISEGADRNTPTQRYSEMGLFYVKERVIHDPQGKPKVSRTTTITGKGQQYFVNKFLAESPLWSEE